MTDTKSDEEPSIRLEIQQLETEFEYLGKELADLLSRRKFINHRIADLQYRLKELRCIK